MTYPPFKTYYQYDASGAYTGSCEAQLSPMDAPGTYLYPSLSTDIQPPTYGVDQIPVFASGTWTVDPDYRGQTWYDQTTGAAVEITAVGQPASNLAATPPPPTLAQAQATQIALLSQTCQSNIIAGFQSTALGSLETITLSATDQTNALMAATVAQKCEMSAIPWAAGATIPANAFVLSGGVYYIALASGVTGTTLPVWSTAFHQTVIDGTVTWAIFGIMVGTGNGNMWATAQQIIQLFGEGTLFVNTQRATYNQKKAAVMACTTVAEVILIV